VFVSDRSNYGSQCAGSLHQDKMILNLFRCSPDGARVAPLLRGGRSRVPLSRRSGGLAARGRSQTAYLMPATSSSIAVVTDFGRSIG
jgi:hypothetical protein